MCITTNIRLIFLFFNIGCSFGQPNKKCSSDICYKHVCTNYPDAVCYPDECTGCTPRYFIGNNEVTDVCGEFLLFIIKFK